MPTPIRQFKDSSNTLHDLDNRFITLTSAAGTLTEEQVSLLQESDQNYIVYNSYIYRKLAETSRAMFYSMQAGNSPTTYVFSVVLVAGDDKSRGDYSRTTISYSLPLAANGTRGGIQIGYSESGTNYAVKLSSEKAYVTVPWTDTKNTAGSTDTSSKIFLVGATTQAANPQTYSDNQVYATNGQLDANKVRIAEAVTMVYDSTNKCINFNFS